MYVYIYYIRIIGAIKYVQTKGNGSLSLLVYSILYLNLCYIYIGTINISTRFTAYFMANLLYSESVFCVIDQWAYSSLIFTCTTSAC